MEKRKEKAAKRVERKAERLQGSPPDIETGKITAPANEHMSAPV
jgi:hypothetical protein